MWCYASERCMKWCSIIGAHFLMAPLSFVWVYGNLSAYMDSVFMFKSPRDIDPQWILGMCVAMMCPGILVTKYFADKIGLKLFGVVTALIVNACLFASAWTINLSIAGTAVLLGAINGAVQGVGSVVAFQYVSGWAPEKAPFFIATTSGVPTLISMAHNQIVTAIVNPDNLKPDAMVRSRTYFSQPEILDRVPTAIIVYAAITLGLQAFGYLLIAPKPNPNTSSQMTASTDKEKVIVGEYSSFTTELQNLGVQENGSPHDDYGSVDATNSTPISVPDDKENAQDILNDAHDIPTRPAGTEETQRQKSIKPKDALKTPVFYAVFMFGTATSYSLLLKSNYYKQFGLLYIHNDRYLTLVGTLIPIVASVSRFCVGAALTRSLLTIKGSIISSLTINSILCAFWYIVPQVDEVLYMFLVLGLAVVQSLNYAILPVASLQIFGPDHFSTNLGLFHVSLFVVGILSPVIISPLMNMLGWFWLFGSAGIFCLLTLVLVVFANFNLLQSS